MSSDLNKTQLSGRLASDIELRYTPKGTAVADVNLAVNSGYGDNQKTNWIGLTIWGKSAEAAANYLGKGRKIIVDGRLDQDEWEDKQTGQKRSKTRVIVENWYFADSKPSGERAQEPALVDTAQTLGGEDDDIPF